MKKLFTLLLCSLLLSCDAPTSTEETTVENKTCIKYKYTCNGKFDDGKVIHYQFKCVNCEVDNKIEFHDNARTIEYIVGDTLCVNYCSKRDTIQ